MVSLHYTTLRFGCDALATSPDTPFRLCCRHNENQTHTDGMGVVDGAQQTQLQTRWCMPPPPRPIQNVMQGNEVCCCVRYATGHDGTIAGAVRERTYETYHSNGLYHVQTPASLF